MLETAWIEICEIFSALDGSTFHFWFSNSQGWANFWVCSSRSSSEQQLASGSKALDCKVSPFHFGIGNFLILILILFGTPSHFFTCTAVSLSLFKHQLNGNPTLSNILILWLCNVFWSVFVIRTYRWATKSRSLCMFRNRYFLGIAPTAKIKRISVTLFKQNFFMSISSYSYL